MRIGTFKQIQTRIYEILNIGQAVRMTIYYAIARSLARQHFV
jgi:tRNA C32,U32 (ribose-2'-O)-methylase TrmJ